MSVSPSNSFHGRNSSLVTGMGSEQEGYGATPWQNSPTKRLARKTISLGLVSENLGGDRQAIHKQIGGRIVQENEVKLAHTLEENNALKI